MNFHALWILLLVLIIAYFVRKLFSPRAIPYFYFSDLESLKKNQSKFTLFKLPHRLFQFAFVCFILAFLDFHWMVPRQERTGQKPIPEKPTEGIAIYLLLDHSGSMRDKMGYLKETTLQFIHERRSDLIGLVAFARVPEILDPLTLDHQKLLNDLHKLEVVQNVQDDGTAIGYAIYKSAHLIQATKLYANQLKAKGNSSAYEIKSGIIIVVTDGFQDPSLLDRGNRLRTIELDEAAEYAKKAGIRLYVINVDPEFGQVEFAPHRRLLERITRLTGGDFYLAGQKKGLEGIYNKINDLERGPIKSMPQHALQHFVKHSLSPFFIILGLLFLASAIILDSTILKRVP